MDARLPGRALDRARVQRTATIRYAPPDRVARAMDRPRPTAVRQSTAMSDRRAARPNHVRPRPPSGSRPAPVKVRPRAPAPGRLAVHTPVRRSRGIPLIGQLTLAGVILVIAAGVLYVGVGGLSTVAAALGSTVTGFVDDITATATPVPSVAVISDAPLIESPDEPYTAELTADLVVTVPATLVGDPDHRLRIYLALKDQAPAPIDEVPMPALARTVIPVELTKGVNDFSITIVGPAGESDPSPIVRYVLDQVKPPITIESPKDGGVVNAKAVTIKGKTQGRSTVIARNAKNGSSITGTAGSDGLFELSLSLATGENVITVESTDPAGNTKSLEFTVRRGSGKLEVRLSASAYSIPKDSLPEGLRLTATVTDPDGRALEGATVLFTLSIPGISTITEQATTGANGRAVFETTVPRGADAGGGNAAVQVTTSAFGNASDVTVVTISD